MTKLIIAMTNESDMMLENLLTFGKVTPKL